MRKTTNNTNAIYFFGVYNNPTLTYSYFYKNKIILLILLRDLCNKILEGLQLSQFTDILKTVIPSENSANELIRHCLDKLL